jgi:Uma2 family endonuclease
MTASVEFPLVQIKYPDGDGQPMAESDEAREYLLYAVKVLGYFFQNRPDVYVSGNLFIYYEEGHPEAVVAPDVFVVFGVENCPRRSYKTWENGGKGPDFVLEITSKSTRSQDQGAKKGIYAFLGVHEYFQYDPTGDYLKPQLQGFRLVKGNYFAIAPATVPMIASAPHAETAFCLTSDVLGLEVRLEEGEMRFYEPTTGKRLLSYEEMAASQEGTERALELAEQALQEAEVKTLRLAAKLRELGIDPDAS